MPNIFRVRSFSCRSTSSIGSSVGLRIGKVQFAALARAIVITQIVALSTGCAGGRRVTCLQYPPFWQPELKRVAVIPFSSQTGRPGDGGTLAGQVQAALVRNGTYEVFTREQAHLQGIDSERVLSMVESGQFEETRRIGRLTTAQALIVGTVTQYGYSERNDRIQSENPVYQKNAQGKQVVVGHRTSERIDTTIVAAVQFVVHVVDTGSGKIVASVPVSLSGTNKSLEFMFQKSGPAILNKLETRAVERIVNEIAVTRSPLKLPANPIRVAAGRYDGQWEWEKKLSREHGNFSVVVSLPLEAARNRFRLAIVPRDGREVLAEEQFVWPDGTNEHALNFDIGSIVEKHGCGPLTAKLYSGEAPIATCEFAVIESGTRG